MQRKVQNLGSKGRILHGNFDRLSNGWPRADCDSFISELKSQLEMDPLSSTALISTDGLRQKLYPHIPRGGISKARKGYIEFLSKPDIPIAVVAHVLRVDLGMQNNPGNNLALREAGLIDADFSDSTRHLRLAAGGLTFCSILAKVTRKEMRREEGQRPRFIRPEEVELLVVPNAILDGLVGPLNSNGSRDLTHIPPSWGRVRKDEIEEAQRRGGDGSRDRGPDLARQRRNDTKRDRKDSRDTDPEALLELHGYLRVAELRDMCRAHSLSPSGRKIELIQRLVDAELLEKTSV